MRLSKLEVLSPEEITGIHRAALDLREKLLSMGATAAVWLPADRIPTEPSFRSLCSSNACGNYGKNYMCPPAVGEVDTLIRQLKGYDRALVYQNVYPLEDSLDYEAMVAAGDAHRRLGQQLLEETAGLPGQWLHLSSGACKVCPVCGLLTAEPCRHPGRTLASVSAYGIHVSALAALAGIPYTNGPNTVTYFGLILYKSEETL